MLGATDTTEENFGIMYADNRGRQHRKQGKSFAPVCDTLRHGDLREDAMSLVRTIADRISTIRDRRRIRLTRPTAWERITTDAATHMRAALGAWRPSTRFSLEPVKHSRDINLAVRTLRYVPGPVLYRTRNSKECPPWAVTDRFLLSYDGNGVVTDGTLCRARFIDIDMLLKDGFLYNHEGFYGCAVRDFDAKKAARMKAVRKVKERIGVA